MSAEEPLWQVWYAIPSDPRVLGVVRAATGREAVEKLNRDEIALGRGPIVPGSYDVERVYEGGSW